MLVGFMANFINPTEFAKIISIICRYNGMDLIYLRPKDINMEKDIVKGKMYIGGKWQVIETEIPPFIDVAPYCFKRKNKDVMDYLRNKTFLSDDRSYILTKEKFQSKLAQDNRFSHLVIPTHKMSNFNELDELLKKYHQVVLKPLKGIKGKGVFVLTKEETKIIVGHKTDEKILTHEEFKEFYNKNIKDENYILQKYISSRTLQGDPFDCRIHVEKNGKGKWQSAKNYIRIGIGQKVISNVNQGGGISDPGSFLKANFGDKWEDINNKLKKLAITLPYKVEELRGTHIMSLGLDVGIDKNGDLYIFEVNDGPATFAAKSEIALLRVNYYKYVLKNL